MERETEVKELFSVIVSTVINCASEIFRKTPSLNRRTLFRRQNGLQNRFMKLRFMKVNSISQTESLPFMPHFLKCQDIFQH